LRTKLLERDRDKIQTTMEKRSNIAKRERGEPFGDCPRIHYNKLIIVLDFRL
jgi:hypothetical protein